jgi:hypothetical protein
MVALVNIPLALEILSHASDSDLLQFVPQIKPIVVRLQTLSWTLSYNLCPPSDNEENVLAVPQSQVACSSSRSSSTTSLEDATRTSGNAGSESSLNGEHTLPPLEFNTITNKDPGKKDKRQARVEKLLTGAAARLNETRAFLSQEEASAVGQPIWESEHPLVVDLQVKSNETKASPQVQFRKLLSQLEIAIRFTRWEEAQYQSSKVQLLVENLYEPRSTGHIAQYLQAQKDIKDKEAAQHGIRHGIKHLVIQQLLKRSLDNSGEMRVCGDVEGFSAIMGFQFTDCRKINFPDLPILVDELRSERFHHIWQLAKESSAWFRRCQATHAGMTCFPLLIGCAHDLSR